MSGSPSAKRAYYERNRNKCVARATAWNREHRELFNARLRKAVAENINGARVKAHERLEKWRKDNPDKVREQTKRVAWRTRHRHLWRKFKILPAEYDAMLVAQGGVCAICKQATTRKNRDGKPCNLVVDHCHKTGKVRGLLCDLCNTGLGSFKDSASNLSQAISYLANSLA